MRTALLSRSRRAPGEAGRGQRAGWKGGRHNDPVCDHTAPHQNQSRSRSRAASIRKSRVRPQGQPGHGQGSGCVSELRTLMRVDALVPTKPRKTAEVHESFASNTGSLNQGRIHCPGSKHQHVNWKGLSVSTAPLSLPAQSCPSKQASSSRDLLPRLFRCLGQVTTGAREEGTSCPSC